MAARRPHRAWLALKIAGLGLLLVAAAVGLAALSNLFLPSGPAALDRLDPLDKPVPELAADRDFKRYATFESRWSQELAQMRRQASHAGDTRFYYTGMVQAALLDRLAPGWKGRILTDETWLETLLEDAARGAAGRQLAVGERTR